DVEGKTRLGARFAWLTRRNIGTWRGHVDRVNVCWRRLLAMIGPPGAIRQARWRVGTSRCDKGDRRLNQPSHESVLGFRSIAAMKLATALSLAAAGFGIFRLMHTDVGTLLEHYATRLHLDPENRFVQEAVSRVSGIDHSQLKALGVGTFFYAALESV